MMAGIIRAASPVDISEVEARVCEVLSGELGARRNRTRESFVSIPFFSQIHQRPFSAFRNFGELRLERFFTCLISVVVLS